MKILLPIIALTIMLSSCDAPPQTNILHELRDGKCLKYETKEIKAWVRYDYWYNPATRKNEYYTWFHWAKKSEECVSFEKK